MQDIIETNRLTLRPFRADDAEPIARQIGDWNVIRWLTSPPWPYALSDAVDFMSMPMAAQSRAITSGDALIGVVGLSERDEGPEPELGYWLGRTHWGQGFMTEAARAMLAAHFATSRLGVYSGYLVDNDASARVLRKLGFRNTARKTVRSVPLATEVTLQSVGLSLEDWRA